MSGAADVGLPALTRTKAAQPQAGLDAGPYHRWTHPNGASWALFFRCDAGYLVRFPGLAEFVISRDGCGISATPFPGVADQTVKHLYLNLVVPLALSRRGRLVLHGSAVEIGDAAAVFVAASGRGKSTLAASFATAGYGFLSDDALPFTRAGGRHFVEPGHPSLRLWDDSCSAVIPAGSSVAPAVSYTRKARFLAGHGLLFCGRMRPVKNIYLLGDGSVDRVALSPAGGREAMLDMVRNSFLLDMDERELLSNQLKQLSSIVNEVPVHHLDYPRRYDALPAVREAVTEHSRRSGARP